MRFPLVGIIILIRIIVKYSLKTVLIVEASYRYETREDISQPETKLAGMILLNVIKLIKNIKINNVKLKIRVGNGDKYIINI